MQCSWTVVAVFVPGEEAKVHVFGKMCNIPRKQATYGDAGLTYTYSGVTHLACPWTPTLEYIRDAVTKTTGQTFNFVLLNRWEISCKGHSLIFVSLLRVFFSPSGTKMGRITWVSIVMTRGSWTPSVPSPPSLWERHETLSSGTEMLGESRAADRLNPWSWSSLMEACSSWTHPPTLSGTTASLLARRFPCLVSTSPLDASYWTERNDQAWIINGAIGQETSD